MITIKEIDNITVPFSSKTKSRLCPAVSFSEIGYEVLIYALTGRYFCFRRVCSYKDLVRWSSFLQSNQEPKFGRARLSVA